MGHHSFSFANAFTVAALANWLQVVYTVALRAMQLVIYPQQGSMPK